MLLGDLVTAIQTVQARIREHGNSLSQNEYRTRISLIDPILTALGWDVSDPALVTHEYAVGNGRADYAFLKEDGSPTAFIEAKRLGEMADASRHETQLFTYAVTQGVKYAGLTDGDRWLFDNLTARFSGGDSRLLDMTLSRESAHQCALKLLLLWHPNLAAGQAVEANVPVFVTPPQPDPIVDPSPLLPPNGTSLSDYRPKKEDVITGMRLLFPDGTESRLQYWWDIQRQVAEWLIHTGLLTADKCPVSRNSGWHIIHTQAQHQNGRQFSSKHELSNGLFLEKSAYRRQHVDSARFLLKHCGQDPASVFINPN